MYIYIDILLITSIYANFFLLKTTACLIHSPIRNSRCIISSLVGSLFSLIIFLPSLNSALLLIIRIMSAALMVIVAFNHQKISELYRTGLIFFFVCFVFAGIEYGISVLSGGNNMLWHNSTLYVNISLFTLVVSTIISYFTIVFFRWYIDGRNLADEKFSVVITHKKKSVSVTAVGDTCNNLTDVITGKPVIICSKDNISHLFKSSEINLILSEIGKKHIEGWRLIPFSTITENGMLPVFKPDFTVIKNKEKKLMKSVDIYIGVVDRQMDYAIFNPKIL